MSPLLRHRPTLPGWPVMVATLAALALLLSFLAVARQAVAQGHLRRAAMAADDSARWRCSTERDTRARQACRELLGTPESERPTRTREAMRTMSPQTLDSNPRSSP